jgi:pilus assembly protein CpaE
MTVSDFTLTTGDADPFQRMPAPAPQPTIRVSVAVVEADVPTRERMMALLGDGVTPFSSIEELASRLTGAVPVVMVLGPSCGLPDALAMAERVIRQYPHLAAVLVVDELSTTLLQQALRAGIRDVLALTGESGALAHAVQRVAISLDQPTRVPASPAAAAGGGGMPTGAPVGEEGAIDATVNGQVITVFSTKGGAGKSVLATSLAVELARRSGEPVCLVDADLQFGDVAVMLKLTPHHTIVDAVSVLDRMDPALLDSLLVTHEPSGLRVMPAPLEPAFADQVGAAEMVTIVEMLRSFCSFVVVDTPAYFNDVVLGLVEVSDRVLLVAGMDIPNVKNVKIGLQTLRLLNTPMEKLLLVLNRANSKVKLDVGEVERTLQVKADVLIPSDVCVPTAVNKGEPVVLHAPKSGVTKAVQQLADRFQPVQQAARRRLR